MTDLRDRMRIYDQAPAPDYWDEVELRASSGSVGTAPPARAARPFLLLAAAMLLALTVGGAALALSRLVDPAPPVPPDPLATSASPVPSASPVGSIPPRSPGGKLAYGLDGDIYLAEMDGREAVRIADGVPVADATGCDSSFYGFGPMWSPDGRYFAYRSADWGAPDGPECAGTVYVSDADGQPVASLPGTGWLVSWSPDSTRIATWVDLSETIGVYGIDGVRQAQLTVSPGCARSGDNDPRWSHDGQSIWVAGCHVPIDGSTPTPVPAGDPRSNRTARYSPDGTRVAYLGSPVASDTAPSLVVAQADGSQDRVLIADGVAWGHDVSLVWSPTGDRIAFHGGRTWRGLASEEILVVEVASGSVTSLASAGADELIYVLAFSRDGDRILFSRVDANDPYGGSLWSVDADGSDARLLVTGTGWGDWQPLAPGS